MNTALSTIAAYFEADHDRLDALFRGFQAHKRADFARAKNYFRDFLRGLKRHIVWEEQVLFPFFEQRSGMPEGMGPTAVMRHEHRLIGAALEALHDKVRQKNPDCEAEENALLEVLGGHNVKEENVLYPALDQMAQESDAADVFHAMEAIPEEAFNACCGSHGRG